LQFYETIYKLTTTAALSFTAGTLILSNKEGYHTTFSDWAGPVTAKSISIGFASYTWGSSTTYNTYGVGFGPGLSLPKRGTGAYIEGTTTLIGKPIFNPNPGTD